MNTEPAKFEKDPYVTCCIQAAHMWYVNTYLEGEPKRII
jgi:hypothetical protein